MFGSFIGAVVVIEVLNKEIVAIVSAIGVISKLSETFLGISVMAFSAGLNELVASLELARSGHTQMAFVSCFGSSMFSK